MKREWRWRAFFSVLFLVTISITWEEAGLRVEGQGPVAPVRPVTERTSPRLTRWDAGLTVSAVEAVTVAGRKILSSTKLKVEWRPIAGIAIDHYEIEAAESIGSTRVRVSAQTTPVTLTGLKSATPYTVTVKGCHDAGLSPENRSDLLTENRIRRAFPSHHLAHLSAGRLLVRTLRQRVA